MKFSGLAAAAVLALAAAPALAQPTADARGPIFHNALVDLSPASNAPLMVTTPAWAYGGDIPYENTLYRGNHFPGLSWTPGPAGTKSYAVIMQDTGHAATVLHKPPILHWSIYNIPASVTALPADMQPTANPPGSSYGPNMKGAAQPYMGPRPPPGSRRVYHLQVFALDTVIATDPGASLDALLGAMKGHVLASGEVTGLGSFDPTAKPWQPPAHPNDDL
ncbi:MAG TPA: YbhB/YbcL family Raf kinase inhibitor-like protein [Caulobacteraceae bacterium]|nr:YbhB/YbcL family Raf kinase inhibitor-like protein [Caulobacteraceae bacterium]